MKKYGWIFRGMLFGVFLWIMVYVIFPQFDETKTAVPEEHLLELLFALPAGILWGYYRFKVLPKRFPKKEPPNSR